MQYSEDSELIICIHMLIYFAHYLEVFIEIFDWILIN